MPDGTYSGKEQPMVPDPKAMNEDYDTCSTLFEIELKQSPLAITIDTNRAQADYLDTCCAGHPDLLAKVEVNAPPLIALGSCTGGGQLFFHISLSASEQCPPPPSGVCLSMSCQPGNQQSITFLSGESVLMVCRDKNLPPAMLTLEY